MHCCFNVRGCVSSGWCYNIVCLETRTQDPWTRLAWPSSRGNNIFWCPGGSRIWTWKRVWPLSQPRSPAAHGCCCQLNGLGSDCGRVPCPLLLWIFPETLEVDFFCLLPLELWRDEAEDVVVLLSVPWWLSMLVTRAGSEQLLKLPSFTKRFLMVLSASLSRDRQLANEGNGSWFLIISIVPAHASDSPAMSLRTNLLFVRGASTSDYSNYQSMKNSQN